MEFENLSLWQKVISFCIFQLNNSLKITLVFPLMNKKSVKHTELCIPLLELKTRIIYPLSCWLCVPPSTLSEPTEPTGPVHLETIGFTPIPQTTPNNLVVLFKADTRNNIIKVKKGKIPGLVAVLYLWLLSLCCRVHYNQFRPVFYSKHNLSLVLHTWEDGIL